MPRKISKRPKNKAQAKAVTTQSKDKTAPVNPKEVSKARGAQPVQSPNACSPMTGYRENDSLFERHFELPTRYHRCDAEMFMRWPY
jgi:hypothetical protein